ncbi:MAG: hypothetical protein FJ276_05965 [Planctomycetes bacterium]|nr:hypothetical protein [Planctomycetota bacterium]
MARLQLRVPGRLREPHGPDPGPTRTTVTGIEWRVAGGAWRVAGGAWRVARGGWRVARGAWRVAGWKPSRLRGGRLTFNLEVVRGKPDNFCTSASSSTMQFRSPSTAISARPHS